MKTLLPLFCLLIPFTSTNAQITSPVLRASFGVDGDLRANSLNGFNTFNDDWFRNGTPGSGVFVIDTTGAASIVSRYATDPSFRKLPFYRTMSYPAYTTITNRLLIDAVFIRDYHGDDSTIFANGASKNGMSPADWATPVAQSIPDKNDILDMAVHVRRALGTTGTDSLWMVGGVSIENTTGSRYFDFEMYQTDIYYDRPSQRFYGYGSDAGHTRWQFDASGNITVPGDIIFTAEFSSSILTAMEPRIWVDRAALSIVPQDFSWTGSFDGATASSQYGYAGILPKTAGVFYTGLESKVATWAGPFQVVLGDNSVATDYTPGQFMEFSVNLTKLGLDPVTLLGGNACGMPFRRVLVKSRASTSFTAALKDFVGPFDFFLAPRANTAADIPFFCGAIGVSHIEVTNPISTSIYTWSTPDGNIIGSTSAQGIDVNAPGTYIVTQQLQSGCSVYATDTVVVTFDANCGVLETNLTGFRGRVYDRQVRLDWTVTQNQDIVNFVIERSSDGVSFKPMSTLQSYSTHTQVMNYGINDNVQELPTSHLYYRLKIKHRDGNVKYTKAISLSLVENKTDVVSINPNPVRDVMNITISSAKDNRGQLFIYDLKGRLVRTEIVNIQKGNSVISITDLESWPAGLYSVTVIMGDDRFVKKMLLTK
ncbi:T9SS type A sorting domain-containing protein [Flavitalea antarctica]